MTFPTETLIWIPVDETLPDYDTTVLIYMPGASGEPIGLGFLDVDEESDDDIWKTEIDTPFESPVTHWAEIPRGPVAA